MRPKKGNRSSVIAPKNKQKAIKNVKYLTCV